MASAAARAAVSLERPRALFAMSVSWMASAAARAVASLAISVARARWACSSCPSRCPTQSCDPLVALDVPSGQVMLGEKPETSMPARFAWVKSAPVTSAEARPMAEASCARVKFAPISEAPVTLVFERSAPLKSAPTRLPVIVAPVMVALAKRLALAVVLRRPVRVAFARLARLKSAPSTWAPASTAPVRSASARIAFARFAPERSTLSSWAPVRLTLLRLVPTRLASRRSAPLRSMPERSCPARFVYARLLGRVAPAR